MVAIPEFRGIDRETFARDIATRYNPAVLRRAARCGAVGDWPAVARARESAVSFCAYLEEFDSGASVDVLRVAAGERGRIDYDNAMTGFNFSRDKGTISSVTQKLLSYSRFENRPAIAVQSAPIAQCLPGFARDNALAILDPTVAPRIWLGTAFTTPAHFDESSNVACVVSGRRRFTLFPPEQIANLYIGPLDFAPTGTPMSLVRLADPGRRDLHPGPLVAPRGIARQGERAGELLVEGRAPRERGRRLRARLPAARGAAPEEPPARAAQGQLTKAS